MVAGSSTWPGNGCPDADGDGVEDNFDAFPGDPTETNDTDSDGFGDNSDACPIQSGIAPDGCPEDTTNNTNNTNGTGNNGTGTNGTNGTGNQTDPTNQTNTTGNDTNPDPNGTTVVPGPTGGNDTETPTPGDERVVYRAIVWGVGLGVGFALLFLVYSFLRREKPKPSIWSEAPVDQLFDEIPELPPEPEPMVILPNDEPFKIAIDVKEPGTHFIMPNGFTMQTSDRDHGSYVAVHDTGVTPAIDQHYAVDQYGHPSNPGAYLTPGEIDYEAEMRALQSRLVPRIDEQNKAVLAGLKDLEKKLSQAYVDRDIAPRRHDKLKREMKEFRNAVEQWVPIKI
jgi:hypothetical protein